MSANSLSPAQVKSIWENACGILQLNLSPAVYNTWILSNPLTKIESLEEIWRCTITSPTAFHSSSIKKRLANDILLALKKSSGKEIELNFEVGSFFKPNFQSNSIKTNSLPKTNSNPKPELFSPETLIQNQAQQAQTQAIRAGLRNDYTFTTFAVSGTNEMAHAAATAVSNKPGEAYNPLFLYGGVGVGKTHLMHAIGNNVLKNNPQAKIIYLTGETFTNEIVSAIQTKKAIQFKQKYRSAQILLIDDIQFIAGKDAVQEEFFHTFNALISSQSQIVLTSDRPPHEISLLEDRLRSRFEAGLMIDIGQPSFELRTAILLIKAKAYKVEIPMEFAQIIASKIVSARKIEGIIKRLKSVIELKNKTLNKELIEELLSGEVNLSEKNDQILRVKPQEVIKTVANHYHIKQISIKGKSRVKAIAQARHICMYLMRERLKLSLSEIGRWYSDRDHTTVMHAVEKISSQLERDTLLQQDVAAIITSLSVLAR